MKIQVINGPNLNMLGIREPDHYGKETYADLVAKIQNHCAQKDIAVTCFQSNHEGDLVALPLLCAGGGALGHLDQPVLFQACGIHLP